MRCKNAEPTANQNRETPGTETRNGNAGLTNLFHQEHPMSLGILNNVSAIYAENNLNNTQSSLQKVLQQLSSGARINSGADDAAGLAVADGLKANEAALTQSTQNAANGIGLLQTADGALSQVTNLLDRAVTLATEAASGTLSSAQVSSADQEYQSILSEVGNIGTTTNFNGISVFSSNAVSTYVGDGTASGSNYYNNTVGTLSASNLGASAPTARAGVSLSATPDSNNGAVVDSVGAGSKGVTTLTFDKLTDTISGTLSITNSTTGTQSYTFAAGTTFAAAVQQAGGAFTNSVVTTSGNSIILTSNTGTTTNNSTASTLSDTQGTAPLSTQTVGVVTAGATQTSFATSSVLRAGTDTLSGTVKATLTGNVSATLSHTFAAGTTLSQAVSLINSDSSFNAAGVVASISAGALKLTGPGQVGSATYTLTADFTGISDAPVALSPNAGTNLSGTTITTAGASTVLVNLNSAIANVAYQRGIIGADSNELQAASNTAASENVNLTASESSIRSTNYGEATSDLAKYEVLSQTGISALAQANSVQQEILKLLQ